MPRRSSLLHNECLAHRNATTNKENKPKYQAGEIGNKVNGKLGAFSS